MGRQTELQKAVGKGRKNGIANTCEINKERKKERTNERKKERKNSGNTERWENERTQERKTNGINIEGKRN